MSKGINEVRLLGHLGADPELRVVKGGHYLLKFRLATNTSYRDSQGFFRDHTEWHSLIAWGAKAQSLERILQKGSKVHISGELRTTNYVNRSGQTIWKTEILIKDAVLCGAKKQEGRENRTLPPPDNQDYTGDDDIPF